MFKGWLELCEGVVGFGVVVFSCQVNVDGVGAVLCGGGVN